jgi:thiol-disulfide isomerase/thioredoxin/fibronectin type 3 domain-containing protein
MKQAVLLICVLWCLAVMASCGANSSLNPGSHGASNTFAVTLENGSGSFTPQVNVSTDQSGAVVTVSAENVQDLTAALMDVSYDSTKYTPSTVDFGTLLGKDGQVLTLAVTNRAAAVPVGIVQVPSSGVTPANGSGVLATLHFIATPFAGNKTTSAAAPTPSINQVKDLSIIGQDTQSVTLRWTESHPGDTDNNGEVNLSDLKNIGLHLNEVVADASDPLAVGMADCNGDGTVTVNELKTLGQNFGTVVDGYVLYTDAAGTQTYGGGTEIKRSDFLVVDDPAAKNHPVVYTFTANTSGGTPVFSVAPIAPSDMAQPGPQSNAATTVVVAGPPDAPTNLAAEGSVTVGAGKIKLTWTPSTAADVTGYAIERKTVSPDGPFLQIATTASNASSYIDSDAALTNQAYGYQIRAVDVTSLYSDYTATVTATPYQVPLPTTPENFTAVTSVATGAAVDLAWTKPGDGTALKFRLYREGPGESTFTMVKQTLNASITSYTDANLTADTNYQYYVTSLGIGNVESLPTSTLTAKSSAAPPIAILGFTTNKTTHCNDGSEPAAVLTVTTDITADSFQFTGPGVFTTTATGGTWKPNGSTPLGKSTLTVVASHGSKSSAPSTLDVFVTTKKIYTQFGTNGHFVDFNDGNANPNLNNIPSKNVPSSPYRKFSYYADGQHVVLFNLWGTWCGPCRGELPIYDKWANHYDAFYYVGMNAYDGDTLAAAIGYFQSQGYNKFEDYFATANGLPDLWDSIGGTGGDNNPVGRDHYGAKGYVPMSIIFDRDGMARLWCEGGINSVEADWNTAISQMTGEPPSS